MAAQLRRWAVKEIQIIEIHMGENKMISKQNYEYCSEFYIVEKKIEVVVTIGGDPQSIRIEALHDPNSHRYSTRAYIQEHITVQPTYPQTNGNYNRKPKEMIIWRDYDLPWTDSDSADGALTRVLGFLEERKSE